MYKISLIDMPFANLQMPSIALTQIKAIIQAEFPEEVSVDIEQDDLFALEDHQAGLAGRDLGCTRRPDEFAHGLVLLSP